jgi:aryl-alcohol dehydrogenase-like predicted oxidoreductase
MKKLNLGKSGLQVSAVGLGTDAFGISVDAPTVKNIMGAASDLGITLIDTAYMYGGGKSEEFIGASIAGRRDEFVIATKGGHPMHGGPDRSNLIKQLEISLKRLKTDYVDLYQVHVLYDATFPMEEMMQTLNDMVRSGKVRYLGLSNMYSWQLCRCNDLAEMHGWDRIVSVQPHYHMFEREVESDVSQYCQWAGVGILPYFPLAGGLLAGRYTRGEEPASDSRAGSDLWGAGMRRYYDHYGTEAAYDAIEALAEFARARDHTPAQLAIAWLLHRPMVSSVIAGVSKLAQLEDNVRAAEWQLTTEELKEVNHIIHAPRLPQPTSWDWTRRPL